MVIKGPNRKGAKIRTFGIFPWLLRVTFLNSIGVAQFLCVS